MKIKKMTTQEKIHQIVDTIDPNVITCSVCSRRVDRKSNTQKWGNDPVCNYCYSRRCRWCRETTHYLIRLNEGINVCKKCFDDEKNSNHMKASIDNIINAISDTAKCPTCGYEFNKKEMKPIWSKYPTIPANWICKQCDIDGWKWN